MDIQTWAKQLIDIYNKSETTDVYNRRSLNESKNIKSVLSAIKSQRFTLSLTQKKADVIHLLKAADVISLSPGPNYLDQFLKLPDVQRIIVEKLQPSMVSKVTQKANDNVRNGTVPNFPKTEAEVDKMYATQYLSNTNSLTRGNAQQEVQYYRDYIESVNDGYFSLETNASSIEDMSDRENGILSLGKVISRQQGNNPGEVSLGWGEFNFELDVPEKSDIIKGQEKTPGISYAAAKKIEEEKVSQQRYKQEEQQRQEATEKQVRDNNRYSVEAQKKRTAQLTAEDRRNMFAKRTQPKEEIDYKKKASAFVESLKCTQNKNNITTQQNIQQNTQQNVQRNSKGMGMSR